MELHGARVLVVGATGVLGGAIASRLVAGGARVAVTGRDAVALERVGAQLPAAYARRLDLLDTEACATAVGEGADRMGGLDALVIATGVAAFGPARDDSDAVVEELFAVNTLGPMAVIRAAVPRLSPGGSIGVLSAVLADVPTAQMAAYSATKAGLSAYLTALRRELRRVPITVLDARPPHMETGLADRALAGDPPRMPRAVPVDVVIDLFVEGMVSGAAELVADLKAGTVSLR